MKKSTAFGSTESSIKEETKTTSSRPVFGIDLGTTNSAISVIVEGDFPKSIKLKNGRMTMPSCVMWKDGKFIVGQEAYEHRGDANVIYSVKRYMQQVGKTVVFKDGKKELKMTPAQVSAEILKGLVEMTDRMYGEIKDVVVTVPAYFDQNGRNATREACELAGLNLIDILNEPTAAALVYDVDEEEMKEGPSQFVTFDFGGGTFDVTLASIVKSSSENDDIYNFDDEISDDKTVECLAISGDTHLGGDDIDIEMFEVLMRKVQEQGYDTSNVPQSYRERMILRLEQLKKQGTTEMYQVHVDVVTGLGQKIDTKVFIGPNEFAEALEPTYQRCKKILDRLLRENPNCADKIILVGGSTKNPLLVNRLKMDYPDFSVHNAVDLDLAVTQGAAIKGKISKFGSSNISVFDILPLTIGIAEDEKVAPLIRAGEKLPATGSAMFSTVVDNQKVMEIQIVQGKSSYTEECVSLGSLEFTDIPEGPAGSPKLAVEIAVTAESQLICVGSINGDRKELKLDLKGSTTDTKELSRNEKLIKKWQKAAKKLGGEVEATLNQMIAGFPDIYSKDDIANFIADQLEASKPKVVVKKSSKTKKAQ